MNKYPELFTPTLMSPALAEMNLGDMSLPEQLLAIEGLLQHYDPVRLLEAAVTTVKARLEGGIDIADRDTPTHYKHLLGVADPGDPDCARAYLHKYRGSSPSAKPQFTELDHTHQDGVVARFLRGGYLAIERRFSGETPNQVIGSRDDAIWRTHYAELGSRAVGYSDGDIMLIHPDEVHRLERIIPGSLTLVVRPPMQRDFSVVFPPDADPQIIEDRPTQRQQRTAYIHSINGD